MNPLSLDLIVELWNFQELEALADPMRKEVSLVRKKIDAVNKELKPLGHTCQKKVDIFLILIKRQFIYFYFILNFHIHLNLDLVLFCFVCFIIIIISQEKEYKEALEAFNEKNKEKVQLITKLMEVSAKAIIMRISFCRYEKKGGCFSRTLLILSRSDMIFMQPNG